MQVAEISGAGQIVEWMRGFRMAMGNERANWRGIRGGCCAFSILLSHDELWERRNRETGAPVPLLNPMTAPAHRRSRSWPRFLRMLNGGVTSGWILFFALSPGLLLALQKKPKPGEAPTPAAKTQAATEQPAAFRAGEQLEYRVLWSSFAVNAANIQLSVMERRPFYGTEAWHFQAQAHTVETTRLIFQVDDQFDSYSAPGDLVSLQYEMYLHEQGKNESSVLRMSSAPTPAPSPIAQARVLPGTRDPLGFLHYLRQVDWTRTPETRSPVFDGRKLYEVRARLDTPRSNVNVPAGNFSASRIAVRVFEGGKQEPMATFGVWLALDGGRTPVLIEAEVPFGTARVELTRAASRNRAATP